MFNVLWFSGFILTTKTHSNTDATAPPVLRSLEDAPLQAILFLTALSFAVSEK